MVLRYTRYRLEIPVRLVPEMGQPEDQAIEMGLLLPWSLQWFTAVYTSEQKTSLSWK